jgi:dihydrodipicolinate synthase/N-acetylneuraminate lyase
MSRTSAPNSTVPSGVYAAAITPIRERSNYVDLGAALEIIGFLEASPVRGTTLLGTTGNFVHMDVEEREKLIHFALKRSRKPMGVNISHSTLDVTKHLGELAGNEGAAFALVLPPYYFRYSDSQLESYFTRVGEALAGHIPLYLYNIPFFTAAIPQPLAHQLLASGLYAGIKDSSGKPEYLTSLRDTPANLIVGNDSALAISRGTVANGVVSGCAGCVPELITAYDTAIAYGQKDRQDALSPLLAELLYWLDQFPAPFGIEYLAKLRGLPSRPDTSWLGDAPLTDLEAWFPAWLRKVREICP